jgi:predicted amidohydrolase
MSKKQPVLGGRESVKVCIAQISSCWLDLDASVERAVKAIKEAAAKGAELIVFPEVWLAGYPFWNEGWDSRLGDWTQARVRFHDAALLIPSEQTRRIAEAARNANAYVVIGCNELDSRPGVETIYNTLLFIGRDGRLLGRHRKLMPTFIERMFWGSGDGRDLAVFDTDIGRIGGLICGENTMTTVRAAMIAQGEHIHIAVFPGSFTLHTGPCLQEPDTEGHFWGLFATRAHAMEAGAFAICAAGYMNPADFPDDFPLKDKLHTTWSNGGSAIHTPVGVSLVGPQYGEQMIYADLQAALIKAVKAIVDTIGHYGRPDVMRLQVRRNDRWESADTPFVQEPIEVERDVLLRAAERHDVDDKVVERSVGRLGVRIK